MQFDRNGNGGFSLLETLIAVAALAGIGVATSVSFINASRTISTGSGSLAKTEFAYSYLTELQATGGVFSHSGVYENRFVFSLEVEDYDAASKGRYHEIFKLKRALLTVDDLMSNGSDLQFEIVVGVPNE